MDIELQELLKLAGIEESVTIAESEEGFFVVVKDEDQGDFIGMVSKEDAQWKEKYHSGTTPDGWGQSHSGTLPEADVYREIENRYSYAHVFGPFGEDEATEKLAEDAHTDIEYDPEEEEVTQEQLIIRFETQEAHDLVDELFGAIGDRGIEGEIILPPHVRGAVEDALEKSGFEPETDYEFVDLMAEVDLNNGYGSEKSYDGEDFFPDADTGPAQKKQGPGAATHGSNPLATKMDVAESEDLYHRYLKEYRDFRI